MRVAKKGGGLSHCLEVGTAEDDREGINNGFFKYKS